VIPPFFLAASILQSPIATQESTLMHSASPVLEEALLLLVAVTGNFTLVYKVPIGIGVAQPRSINTLIAPRAKTNPNFFIITSQELELN
jgi:hypothetical protein